MGKERLRLIVQCINKWMMLNQLYIFLAISSESGGWEYNSLISMHLIASLNTSTNEMMIAHISKIIYIELIIFDID